MKRFIFTERNSIYIIDLQQSLSFIDRAYEFVKGRSPTVAPSSSSAPKSRPRRPSPSRPPAWSMPYVNQRWLGGMLTNFATVAKRAAGEGARGDRLRGRHRFSHTQKELLLLRRELTKLESNLSGIATCPRPPRRSGSWTQEGALLAVDEARKLGIPVVAILDTNCDGCIPPSRRRRRRR